MSTNQEAKTIAVTDKSSYSGEEEIRILGVALPLSRSLPARSWPYKVVKIIVKNPKGLVMLFKGAGVSGDNGAFTYAFVSGGSEEWITGKYEVDVDSVKTTFDYKATESEAPSKVGKPAANPPPEETLAKYVDQFKDLDLYKLYYQLGYYKWFGTYDPEFRKMAPRRVFDRSESAILDPNDLIIGAWRFLARYWENLVEATCDWAQSQAGPITLAMSGSLAVQIAQVLPAPEKVSVAPFAAMVAIIMIKSGIRTICDQATSGPPSPPLSGMD